MEFGFFKPHAKVESGIVPKAESRSAPAAEIAVTADIIADVTEKVTLANIRSLGGIEFKIFPDSVAFRGLDIADADDQSSIAEEANSDLIPGAYEGGRKIWECTEDLLSYLASSSRDTVQLEGTRVLDLGCGVGLLGVFALCSGASNVSFQDFNSDVISRTTIPTVIANRNFTSAEEIHKICRFYCGDWEHVSDLVGDEMFDVILTSETIYQTSSYNKLINFLRKHLSREGTILLAAKTFYFGVGGGTRLFEEELKKDGSFQSELVWSFKKGLSREILMLRRTV